MRVLYYLSATILPFALVTNSLWLIPSFQCLSCMYMEYFLVTLYNKSTKQTYDVFGYMYTGCIMNTSCIHVAVWSPWVPPWGWHSFFFPRKSPIKNIQPIQSRTITPQPLISWNTSVEADLVSVCGIFILKEIKLVVRCKYWHELVVYRNIYSDVESTELDFWCNINSKFQA